jgi:hypothetical protein
VTGGEKLTQLPLGFGQALFGRQAAPTERLF